jgi:hypothetical protein
MKKYKLDPTNQQRFVHKKNWEALKALAGIWKGKKLIDPVKWQRKVRSGK